MALLVLAGGDGRSNFSTSLGYIEKAGELGVDMAVLPENFAQVLLARLVPSPFMERGEIGNEGGGGA